MPRLTVREGSEKREVRLVGLAETLRQWFIIKGCSHIRKGGHGMDEAMEFAVANGVSRTRNEASSLFW